MYYEKVIATKFIFGHLPFEVGRSDGSASQSDDDAHLSQQLHTGWLSH